jgi:ComF family protein
MSPFVHEGPLARAIHRFKYEDRPELAPPLAALLAPGASALLSHEPGLLLAVPLHPRRFAQRKFDQAELLTRSLAKELGVPEAPSVLRRVRPTSRQVGLSPKAREDNLRGAFIAAQGAHGLRLTLVDDVYTTGATARAAARALLDAGAAQVTVLTLARAYRERLPELFGYMHSLAVP